MKKKKRKSNRMSMDPYIEDPVNTQSYWNKALADSGLSMESGRAPRRWVDRGTENERREDALVYVGSSADLVRVEEEQESRRTGHVRPHGHGPQG